MKQTDMFLRVTIKSPQVLLEDQFHNFYLLQMSNTCTKEPTKEDSMLHIEYFFTFLTIIKI